MHIGLRMTWKILASSLLTLAIFMVGADIARADEVVIGGATEGSFNPTNGIGVPALPGLGYLNGSFQGQTVNGSLAINNQNILIGTVSNLGTFTLIPSNTNYDGNTFKVAVSFFHPSQIISGNFVFNATLTGNAQTGVFVDFDNDPHMFTFLESLSPNDFFPHGAGSFSLSLNDLFIFPGANNQNRQAAITGNITNAFQSTYVPPPPPPPGPIPEPGTLILLGTGLAAITAKVRGRNKGQRS